MIYRVKTSEKLKVMNIGEFINSIFFVFAANLIHFFDTSVKVFK